jgi:hypothetical protein
MTFVVRQKVFVLCSIISLLRPFFPNFSLIGRGTGEKRDIFHSTYLRDAPPIFLFSSYPSP